MFVLKKGNRNTKFYPTRHWYCNEWKFWTSDLNFLHFSTTILLIAVLENWSASLAPYEICIVCRILWCTSCQVIEPYLCRVRFSISPNPDKFITYKCLL